jgi:hypothetical protein
MDIDHIHESTHPANRPIEPEHPMMLDGSMTPGDVEFMAACVFEELLMVGTPLERLRDMTIDPEYQALYGMRLALGPRLDEILDRIHGRADCERIRATQTTCVRSTSCQPSTTGNSVGR